MEPSSKSFGGHHAAEECHSSESGWTMYIGSGIDGENGCHHDQEHSDDDNNGGKRHGYYDHKDDSDDSMVSDASSGPSTHQRARPDSGVKHEDKAKAKKTSKEMKQSASEAAKVRREYKKAAEKKAKIMGRNKV